MNNFGIYYVLISVAFIVSALFIIWQSNSRPNFSLIMKMTSSVCFTVLGIACTFFVLENNLAMLFMVLGLLFSIFGDIFLGCLNHQFLSRDNTIKCGMIAFAIAQCFYFTGISVYSGFSIWAIVIGVVIALLILFGEKPLKLTYGKLKPFVLGYSLTLACSVGASLMSLFSTGFGSSAIMLFVGFTLFLLSDLVLAFIYFRKEREGLVYLNLSLYYIAQIIIASSIMFM